MLESSNTSVDAIFKEYVHRGFLPDGLPLESLPSPYYKAWEDIASQLPALIQTGQIRDMIDNLPVCSIEHLQTEREWRRAYVIMGYLSHAYIWGGDKPKEILPPSISKPFLEISSHLEVPACATYSGLTLWNFKAPSPNADTTDPDNLHVQTSWTGTKDEEWFMLISVAVEAKGARLISQMQEAIKAVTANDADLLTSLLYRFADGLSDLTLTLKRMYEHNRPAVFFHQLRPFLAGSKNMGPAGLPRGVYYDVGDGVERPENWKQLSGGSNAQSSLIQALDIFLGIKHSDSASGENFIEEMRKYMPGPHRRFLQSLAAISNIRTYIQSSADKSTEKEAYNAAVNELKAFRDTHIQMVTRYIVMAAKQPNPLKQDTDRVNLATASQATEKEHHLAGTGGTNLIPFLKHTRDTVQEAKC
ncbi:hypothetical protein N7522_006922 [Penicillium canescens]|uniref:Indoleamine 2,3-dioxygenase n=1 Tax=Penicillium canescens TaxID=5083 RepID=A0AAD6N6E6_PENCN|nr:uncharacterized protein N7446_009982 [Penicillium canescens]KAJ6001695.1 hypothetical protein N7522_006922 [Penicillium canescens]KAJ6035226.1 hypothetical protein N7460_009401 [Penicillium canescens]KAJ6046883.1 hypothetical protein N7444_008137 [Penicillium canescens]KAJ6053970.1 hypothetical protein N7446_009982 [Penicillium canescens]